MDISQFTTLNLNQQPVWTSLQRLTWRQKLALRWPYTRERGKRSDGLFLLVVLVSIGGFILRGLTPTEQNDTLFNFVLMAWMLVSMGPVLLIHYLAQTTLLEMRVDPRFRFATTQDSPGFRLADMYFQHVRRDFEMRWTPELSARVNEWLEGRWDADVASHYVPTQVGSYSGPDLHRWEVAQECMESFAMLELPLPAGFAMACEALLILRRTAYMEALEEEIVMQRDAYNDLRREIAVNECELEALSSTQQVFTFNRGIDAP